MIDKERFIGTLAKYDITAESIVDQLDHYAEFLFEYNKKVNLTALKTPWDYEIKHFLDSLLFAKQPEARGSLCDVGTGAGFPGVVTKLYKPDIALTLIEPTKKKCDFLQELTTQLNIKASIENCRAEGANALFETFDVVTARAVAAMGVLCEYCLPLVKVGGLFIALKGNETLTDTVNDQLAIFGARYEKTVNFVLTNDEQRSLIFIRKYCNTKAGYPRATAKILKKPIF